jgi:leucyl-tRNA synthetase
MQNPSGRAEGTSQNHKKVVKILRNLPFNTAVSSFMICVNELTEQKCNKKDILSPLTILISSFAPHIAEELWQFSATRKAWSMQIFPNGISSILQNNRFVSGFI